MNEILCNKFVSRILIYYYCNIKKNSEQKMYCIIDKQILDEIYLKWDKCH